MKKFQSKELELFTKKNNNYGDAFSKKVIFFRKYVCGTDLKKIDGKLGVMIRNTKYVPI